MLWIALELPQLPLQLVERAGTSSSPRVIAEGPVQRPLVACANTAARAAGVREGQAVAAARALAGELKVTARNREAERAALEDLAGWAGQFTPMMCVDGQGIVLEVGSSLRLFDGAARLAGALRQGVRELGYHATIGMAPTPLVARLFARAEAQGIGVRSCSTLGELRERIAGLPLFLLQWPGRTLALLADLGVLRFRDILALPRPGLAKRFGPQVADELAKLLGEIPDPRTAYSPPQRFHVRLELPCEVGSAEALLFPLRRLLAQMEGFLRGRGAGVQRLALCLEPVRGKATRIDLEFATPERDAAFILSIAREKLGRTRLEAPTLLIDLRAEALLPHEQRSATWLPGREEQAIDRERLLERLAARIGGDRVFGIALADDHRPELGWGNRGKVQNEVPGPSTRKGNRGQTLSFAPRPVWLLQRPQRLITEGGRPAYQGALQLLAGPERIEAGWWDGEPVARDYFVASNPGGETRWIYREHRNASAWYLHGVFA